MSANKMTTSIRGAMAAQEAPRQARSVADALIGMAVYNGWTKAERMHWHEVAGSAVPAEAWEAWKAEGVSR